MRGAKAGAGPGTGAAGRPDRGALAAILPAALAALAAGLAACAPPDVDAPPSERARAAPPPLLVPTETFDAPLAEGAAAADRLGTSREALAARAAALRSRGEALAGTGLIDPAARERLDAGPGRAGATGPPPAP